MKIGILTQPLRNNYGGLLQCWALQQTLERLGHEPWIIQREYRYAKDTTFCYVVNLLKSAVKHFLRHTPVCVLNSKQRAIISRNTSSFVQGNIVPRTTQIYSNSGLKEAVAKAGFEAYVVGSDQVWRKSYSPKIENYFLDFVYSRTNIRRISYAASFGLDSWQYNSRETRKIQRLVRKFDAVSVREKSAVSMCRQFLDVEACHVLDPTLLIDGSMYDKLIADVKEPMMSADVCTYFLDANERKEKLAEYVANKLQVQQYSIMPKRRITSANVRENINECIYPSVELWLYSLKNARFVITDSFHGTVFSIIFNRPFWVVANENRGTTRIDGLLEDFGLQDRMVSLEELPHRVDMEIDWEKVNAIRKKRKEQSLSFLRDSLKA